MAAFGIGDVIFLLLFSLCFLPFFLLFFMPVYFLCYFTGSFFVLRVMFLVPAPSAVARCFVGLAQHGRGRKKLDGEDNGLMTFFLPMTTMESAVPCVLVRIPLRA